MIRWSYVLTRLFFVVGLLTVLWFLMNPLLRFGLIVTGRSIVGAKVNIERLETSLQNSLVELDSIRIADPDAPLENLLEIEHARFDFDNHALLRRRLVVSEGRISGMKFNSDRTKSGAIEKEKGEKETGPNWTDKASELGKGWIDSSLDRMEEKIESDLQSIRLANELKQRWPAEYERLESEAEEISQRGKDVAKRIELYSKKPLDHLDKFQATLVEIDTLRKDAIQLKRNLNRLRNQMKSDRVAIKNAKEHDQEYVRKTVRMENLNAQNLSEYFLGPEMQKHVESAVSWIQWGRGMLGNGDEAQEQPVDEPTHTGISVIFPHMRMSPDFLIRKLHLDGDGQVDGKPYQFAGIVKDITHQSSRHDQPLSVRIKTEGAIQLTADAIFDRRQSEPFERIVINIPALSQPARKLGNDDDLSFHIAKGTAKIEADLIFRGEQVSGNIVYHQQNVSVTPNLAKTRDKEILLSNIEGSLDAIQDIQATVEILGSMKKPKWKLQSNLGDQLKSVLDSALQSELAAREQQLLAQANKLVDDELASLEKALFKKHGDVLKQLELGDKELAVIKSEIASRIGAPSEVLDKGKKLLNLFRR